MAERNAEMIARIEAAPVRYPFSFVVAGDSGAWPSPFADAIYSQLLRQMASLDPPPLFFANLGDFAGPGTPERHEHYLRLVDGLPLPNLCVVGNHDLDDPVGAATFEQIHGPFNYSFAYGKTRFVALHCQMGTDGPREEDLAYLDACLRGDDHQHRVVLMHMPPRLGGHYAPHAESGFSNHEAEFLTLLKEHGVKLVCCAHVVAYDYHMHEGIAFVVSGGGGIALCSHFDGACSSPPGNLPQRGSFYHFVQITVEESGAIAGRVVRAFEEVDAEPVYGFARPA